MDLIESSELFVVLPRYDKTGSGSISSYEVKEMMVALGYQAEEKYLTGLLELFGARSSASANSDRLLQATRSLCRIGRVRRAIRQGRLECGGV